MKRFLAVIKAGLLCGGLFAVLNLGAQTFQEVSLSAGIDHYCYHPDLLGGGVAVFDFDNDGWEDIYLTGGHRRDKLYKNLGNGQFVEVGIAAGLGFTENVVTQGVVTGDIDNDGDRDIFLTTDKGFPNYLLINDGQGRFEDSGRDNGITEASWTTAATMGYFNLDGWLDIYAVNYIQQLGFVFTNGQVSGFAHRGYANFLYINDGAGGFTEVAAPYQADDQGCGLAVAATDYDQDGDPDIYIANDFGQWVVPNVMLQNQYPQQGFTDVSAAAQVNAAIYGMGIAIGDYDEDGKLDYYTTNIGRNVLLHNEGNGVFSDVTDSMQVANIYVDSVFATSWGTAFLDYDNDSYLDLFVANGKIPTASFLSTSYWDPNKLYRNPGTGAAFVDVSTQAGIDDSTQGRGMAWIDYDLDGDLDIFVAVTDAHVTTHNHALLFRNDLANENHWLKVRLTGTVSNRDAFGAHVRVFAGGRSWIREIDGGSSHLSQHSSVAHFGLGAIEQIDSMVISWPGGNTQRFAQFPANQQVQVIENLDSLIAITTSLPTPFSPGSEWAITVAPNPFSETVSIFYTLPAPAFVKVEMYDFSGKRVACLLNGQMQSGNQQLVWDGKDDRETALLSGLYMCVLQAGASLFIRKISLIR